MVEFTELETLIYLHRLKSFTGVAEAMFTTQPNISKRIAKMEEVSGKKLIERKGKKFIFTPEGEIMHDYAVRLIGLREEMTQQICEPAKIKGHLRIGASESIVIFLLPQILSRFQEKFPEVRLDLQVETSVKLRRILLDGDIDMAFLIGQTSAPYFKNIPLIDYEMGWFLNRDLASDLSFDELLKEHPLITFSRDTPPFVNLQNALRSGGHTGCRIHSCASLSVLINLTVHKTGIGILPREILKNSEQSNRLKEISGIPIRPLNYFIAYRDVEYRSMFHELSDIALEAVRKENRDFG